MNDRTILLVTACLLVGAIAGGLIAMSTYPVIRDQERNERVREVNRNYAATIETINHVYEVIQRPCEN